jgi:hypothetical protein
MKTLEERIARAWVAMPMRPAEEPEPGETENIIHFCLERSDGALLSIERDMELFTPPADDSTIIVIKLRPRSRTLT